MTGMSFSVFLAASVAAAMAGPFWLMVGEGGDQRLQNAVLLSPSYCICESYMQWVPQMKTRGVWNIHTSGVAVRGIH
jgi:hypothetical protein